jgi:Holliday junction resolvase-like predicted endonuclease
MTQTTTIRVRQEGKGVNQMTVDLDNPLKSLEELETKIGVKCPEERKKELLDKLTTTTSALPAWLQTVSIPEWYVTADAKDVANALQWGHEIVQEQKRMSDDKLHDQLDLKWKKMVEQTREEFEQSKIELQNQLAQRETEIQRWKQSAMESITVSGIEGKLQSAKQEWLNEQAKILDVVERERQSLHQHLHSIQTQLKQTEDVRKSLQEKLDQKASNELHLSKSVHKGDAGEELVENWLRSAFLGANIQDTSSETGKMDMRMEWEGMTIMVDVKHHEGKLHSIKDIQKFYDNFRSNPDVPIAILLCTRTRVTNHDRYWVETEVINDNQIAVFMNNVSQNPIERLQLVAGTVLQPWRQYLRLRQDMTALVAGDELKAWTEQARQVLVHGWTSMMKLQDHWAKTHSVITTSLKEFQTVLGESAQELQTELESIQVNVDVPKKKKTHKSTPK